MGLFWKRIKIGKTHVPTNTIESRIMKFLLKLRDPHTKPYTQRTESRIKEILLKEWEIGENPRTKTRTTMNRKPQQ